MTPVAALPQKAQDTMKNRLDNIATRQRSTRVRDLIFAACVALAAVVSGSGVSVASNVANTHVAEH